MRMPRVSVNLFQTSWLNSSANIRDNIVKNDFRWNVLLQIEGSSKTMITICFGKIVGGNEFTQGESIILKVK